MPKYSAYSITLRPLSGITQDDIDMLMKLIDKYCVYAVAITEKEDDARHIHAGFFLTEEKTISAFNQIMKRQFRKSFEERESIWAVAYRGKPMYNDAFVKEYCLDQIKDGKSKDDAYEILFKNLPPNTKRLEFYKDVVPRSKFNPAADPYYAKLQKLWYELTPHNDLSPDIELSNEDMHKFLYDLMFKYKKIRIISDSRKCRRLCKCLRHYIMNGKYGCYPWKSGNVESEHGFGM